MNQMERMSHIGDFIIKQSLFVRGNIMFRKSFSCDLNKSSVVARVGESALDLTDSLVIDGDVTIDGDVVLYGGVICATGYVVWKA